MLAELFFLRLEVLARAAEESVAPVRSPAFVPVSLSSLADKPRGSGVRLKLEGGR